MKKRNVLLLVAILLLLSSVSYAQEIGLKKNDFKFGPKAGLNLSFVSASGVPEFSPQFKPSFHAGAMFNYHFGFRDELSAPGTGWFGLQAEILYSAQGFKSDYGDQTFNYLSVPILAKVYFTKELSLEVGPFFNYLISVSAAKMTINGTKLNNLSDLSGGFDLGVCGGLSYELGIGFLMGVRYSYGFSDMANNLNWKNSNLAVSIGWLF